MKFNCPFCENDLEETETHGEFGESIYECESCKKEFRLIIGELKDERK